MGAKGWGRGWPGGGKRVTYKGARMGGEAARAKGTWAAGADRCNRLVRCRPFGSGAQATKIAGALTAHASQSGSAPRAHLCHALGVAHRRRRQAHAG